MEFREATPDDSVAIARLHADSWRRTYRGSFRNQFLDGDLVGERDAVWRERLDNPPRNQFVWMAVDGDRLAGFVCAYAAEHAAWGSFIDNLHVSHDVRRAGVGTELMGEAGVWLAVRHPDLGVYLWVLEANVNARRFYESIGATNSGVVEVEVHGGGTRPSCRYTWSSAVVLRQAAKARARSKP